MCNVAQVNYNLMFSFIVLAAMLLTAYAVSKSMPSQMDRMSLAFGVAAKPFGVQKPKPKKPKVDKFRDLMAIAKYAGTGVVGLSGKIAGTVFLNNNVVRVWHKTKTVRDTLTNLVKGTLSGVSTSFRSLTASQISAWNGGTQEYLRKNTLAEVKRLTGAQAFQRVNNVLLSLGLTGTSDRPGSAIPTALTALSGVADESAQTFGLSMSTIAGALAALPANTYARVYATRQVGISKSKFSKSDYRLIGIFNPAVATNPLAIETDYIASFGALVVDQRIGFAIELITRDAVANTFAQSGRIYSDTVVVA